MSCGVDKLLCDSLRVVLADKSVLIIGKILRRAAALYKQARKTAGGCFSYHYAVGVIGGGENEKIRSCIVYPELLTVVYSSGEYDLVRKTELFHISGYFLPVSAVSDYYHAEIRTLFVYELQSVQQDMKALVPEKPSHKQKQRHFLRYTVHIPELTGIALVRRALGKVNAVGHYHIVSLISYAPQIVSRSLADCPHLIADGYVLYHKFCYLRFEQRIVYNSFYILVEFCVICHYQGSVLFFLYVPCKNGGRKGTMTVDYIKVAVF